MRRGCFLISVFHLYLPMPYVATRHFAGGKLFYIAIFVAWQSVANKYNRRKYGAILLFVGLA